MSEVVNEQCNSDHFQKALDMEALGYIGITPEEKYRREVGVVLDPDKGAFYDSLKSEAKVLDIACGSGDSSVILENSGKNFQVTAVDSAPNAIAKAQSRFPESKVNFQVADMKNPSGKEGEYDAITCFGRSLGYFETYEEYIEALKNWRKLLKDKGKIAIEFMEWGPNQNGDGNWRVGEDYEVDRDPKFPIVNKRTGEKLGYTETAKDPFKYPGKQLNTPIDKRRGGRIYVDENGIEHKLGNENTLFVDILRSRNFPLIKRILEEAGFKNIRLVEDSKPLTHPLNPKTCNVYAITAEKADESEMKAEVSGLRGLLRQGFRKVFRK